MALWACSYLVVRYAAGDKVAQTVGFYYMANAGGRLVGECHLSSAPGVIKMPASFSRT